MEITISVPGSKSITQRAIVIASLADGESTLDGFLDSEDTRLLRSALSQLGIESIEQGKALKIQGKAGYFSPCSKPLFMGNNGTGIRLLASLVALGNGSYILTGSERMKERPIEPLLDALRKWDVDCHCLEGHASPPVQITGGGLKGGETILSANLSSQFLSSLLLVAPYCREPAVIRLNGTLVSRPYVYITLAVMGEFGINVTISKEDSDKDMFVAPQGSYQPRRYQIEGDASSASYFWAAAAVTGAKVTVANIPQNPLQGDARFADILGLMGCMVERKKGQGVSVTGPARGELKSIDIDMKFWPDVVPTLAVVAAFANGATRITNVEHLRLKETDRIRAIATELSRLGVAVEELKDGLIIHGGTPLHSGVIETYDDHRIAMAFAVAGLFVQGLEIKEPECVKKSFPNFWQLWENVRKQLT